MSSSFHEIHTSESPDETMAVAARVAARLAPGAVLALHGDLGAGKTCFVQGLAAALEVEQAVSSPTYTLVNEYPGPLPVYHIDLYRISDPEEALDFGLEEYFDGPGVTVVEWAERGGDVWPDRTLHLRFHHLGIGQRRIEIEQGGGS